MVLQYNDNPRFECPKPGSVWEYRGMVLKVDYISTETNPPRVWVIGHDEGGQPQCIPIANWLTFAIPVVMIKTESKNTMSPSGNTARPAKAKSISDSVEFETGRSPVPRVGSLWTRQGTVFSVEGTLPTEFGGTVEGIVCRSVDGRRMAVPVDKWHDVMTPLLFRSVPPTDYEAPSIKEDRAEPPTRCRTCNSDGVYATDGSGPWDCYECGRKADVQQKELFEVMRLTEQRLDRALVGINPYNHPEAYSILTSLKNSLRQEASSKVPYRESRISARVTETLANALVETARNLGLQTSSADSILLSECLGLLKEMEKMAKANKP